MNIYKSLNEITLYIENNLENDIDYNVLAKMLGVNVYTLQRIFTMICGISLSEYIRKRRLSSAGVDIYNDDAKVIDLAVKYGYENPTSFSRSLEHFHGVKPSKVDKNTKLKTFPRIVFDENIKITKEVDYEIIEMGEFTLYGLSIEINNKTVGVIAPKFFKEIESKYFSTLGEIKYGMITYDSLRDECDHYYCLYDKYFEGFERVVIPKGKWLKFRINSQDAKDIQEVSHRFYEEFTPSTKYNLKDVGELEYYHDGITDFLVPIY